jgi:hypothetical protein
MRLPPARCIAVAVSIGFASVLDTAWTGAQTYTGCDQEQKDRVIAAVEKDKEDLQRAEEVVESYRVRSLNFFLQHGHTYVYFDQALRRARQELADTRKIADKDRAAFAKCIGYEPPSLPTTPPRERTPATPDPCAKRTGLVRHGRSQLVRRFVDPDCGKNQRYPGGSGAAWSGTYSDGPHVYTISGSGGAVTGSGKWTSPGEDFARHGGTVSFGSCTANGNTAQCPNATAQYHDPDKTIATVQRCTLTLSGNSLSTSCTLTSANASWRVAPYPSAIHAGASFSDTNKRIGTP